MKEKLLTLFLALVCFFFAFASTSLHTVQAQGEFAYINVAVATLWAQPDQLREIDAPSAKNPVDLRTWTTSMTLMDKMWLVRHLETQALYGQKVKILEERGEWVKVAVVDQPTPRHADGYPGWLPKIQLTTNQSLATYEGQPVAMIKHSTVPIYNSRNFSSRFMEVSYNTFLPVVKEDGSWVVIATPNDGEKWIPAISVRIHPSMTNIPRPTRDDLVGTAKMFLDLPYLWAGVSGFGFDCSGFTYTIYKSFGITIPRDSSVQATAGTPVERANLLPGDLVFFARDNGKGKVHHVAMYIGNGQMIHSPKSERAVEIIPLDHPDYAHEYAGARRFVD